MRVDRKAVFLCWWMFAGVRTWVGLFLEPPGVGLVLDAINVIVYSSYLITKADEEHSHHSPYCFLSFLTYLFIYLCAIMCHLISVPRWFPFRSWYTCALETNDVFVHWNTCAGYFTFWTSEAQSTSCVHIHGNSHHLLHVGSRSFLVHVTAFTLPIFHVNCAVFQIKLPVWQHSYFPRSFFPSLC